MARAVPPLFVCATNIPGNAPILLFAVVYI